MPSWSHSCLADWPRAGTLAAVRHWTGRVSASRARGGSHARDEGHRERRDARPRCVQAPAPARGGRRTELAPRPAASPGRAPAAREPPRPGDATRAAARAPGPPGATGTASRRCDRARTREGSPPGTQARSRVPPAGLPARPGVPQGRAARRGPGSTRWRHGERISPPAGGQREPRARGPGPGGQAQAGAAQEVTRALTRPAGPQTTRRRAGAAARRTSRSC